MEFHIRDFPGIGVPIGKFTTNFYCPGCQFAGFLEKFAISVHLEKLVSRIANPPHSHLIPFVNHLQRQISRLDDKMMY
jgi:hypothetical protein